MIRLSISEQGQPPRLVTFNKSAIVLGRVDACDLCLTGKGVSSNHCRFTAVPGGLMVEDLGSTNGTYVNRVRIGGPTQVGAHDEIVLAIYQIRVIDESGMRATTGAPPRMPTPMPTGSMPHVGGPSMSTSGPNRPATSPMPMSTASVTGPPPYTSSGATPTGQMPTGQMQTGAMQTGGAFDDARWVREWERLDKLASEWLASNRDRHRLLRGDKLAHARRWLEQGRGRQPVPKREHKAFIQASASAVRLRIIRNVGIGGLVLGIGAVAAWKILPEVVQEDETPVVVADPTQPDAKPDVVTPQPVDDDAERRAEIVAKASALVATDPDVAALLALDVLRSLPDDADVRGSEAEQVLRRVLQPVRGQPLRGHNDAITLVAMSPDGRFVASVATGTDAAVAQLWDLERPGLGKSQKLRGQIGAIRSLAFAPDGGTLVIGADEEELWRWDLRQSPPTPQTIAAPEGGIVALAWSDDSRWLVAGGRSGRARLVDTKAAGGKSVILEGHTGSITDVDIDAAGTRVVTASQDGLAMLWRFAGGVQTGKPTKFEGHMGAVNSVALSPDGKWVLTGGADSLAKLWAIGARVPVPRDFTAHSEAVEHVAFSPDGRLALTASVDDVVTVWKLTVAQPELAGLSDPRGKGKGDVTALEVRGPRAGDPDRARRQTWAVMGAADGVVRTLDPTQIDKTVVGNEIPAHPEGRVVIGVEDRGAFGVSGGVDGIVRVWDLANAEPAGPSKVGRGHAGQVVDIAVNTAGTRIITGGADGSARLWEAGDKPRLRELATMPMHKGKVQVAMSPAGGYAATSSEDGIVRLWSDDATGNDVPHKDYPGHTAEVNELIFGPDGTVLVSVSNDKTARVWRMTEDPAKDVVVLPHDDLVTHVAIGPKSRWLITATVGALNLWDLSTADPAKATRALRGHDSDIRSVAMSPDGHWAASGDANERVVLWDMTAADPKPRRLKAHSESVDALAFSADGRWLASAARDRTVFVWRLSSKHPEDDPIQLTGHESGVTKLLWSNDGKWLYSGDTGGTVRAWPLDVKDPSAGVMVLDGHSSVVSGLAIVSDGSVLATSSYDGAARLWPLHPEGLHDVACAMIGRDLTADEWTTHIGGSVTPICE
jgi:WD40 repeat protein